MTPATALRPWPPDDRLLHIDRSTGAIADAHVRDLPALLAPGDVLVANDAATLPAALHTRDRKLELRLLAAPRDDGHARALLFGAGDYRTATERRPEPPRLFAGALLDFGPDLHAEVTTVEPDAPRLLGVRFDRSGAALYQALYRYGKPIQYSYVPEPLALAVLQTRFAARPWAVEMPSAGRPLTFSLLRALRERGVTLATLTHAAGLSSTGDDALDQRLPLPERYIIPEATIDAITHARAQGARIIAAGTTVVRALESNALDHDADRGRSCNVAIPIGGAYPHLHAGEGEARLVIGPGFVPRVVSGLLTGMHPVGTSHFALMTAFAPRDLLERALSHAERAGYLEHELGDSCLVL